MLSLETDTYLGAVVVLGSAGGRLRVRLERTEPAWRARAVWARPAMPFAYEAREGDRLLALGQGEDFYIVGVLEGAGRASLSVGGDLELRSREGSIRLAAGEGIELDGERVRLRATRIEMLAHTLVQKLGNVFRRVADLLQTRAGRRRLLVDGDSFTKTGRTLMRSEGDTRIDGEKIYLG